MNRGQPLKELKGKTTSSTGFIIGCVLFGMFSIAVIAFLSAGPSERPLGWSHRSPPRHIPIAITNNIVSAVYNGRAPATTNLASEWVTHGKNVYNSRHAHGSKLTDTVVSNPSLFTTIRKCDFFVNASVTATPAFEDESSVYFPAWNGNVYKWSSINCSMLWRTNIFSAVYGSNLSRLTAGQTASSVFSRSTPVIWRNYVIIGIQRPGDIVFLDKHTGAFVRKINLNPHTYAIVTMSGAISNDWLYVGTSSTEEVVAINPSYPCCSFYGTTHGIDLVSMFSVPSSSLGNFVSWTTPTIPAGLVGPGKWSGNGVWGSTPSVDERTGTVYFSTGNPYSSPDYYEACVNADKASANPNIELHCNIPLSRTVYYNSILALDMRTGAVKSFLRTDEYDSWNLACVATGNINCPATAGADVDYGMAPMLDYAVKCGTCNVDTDPRYLPHTTLNHATHHTTRGFCRDPTVNRLVSTFACPLLHTPQFPSTPTMPPTLVRQMDPRNIPILYVGQKSGMMHAISVEHGILERIWVNPMCPGAALGGVHWGASFDNERVYAACSNNGRLRWTLPNGTITNCSGWQSYDKYDGSRVWAVVNPVCFDQTSRNTTTSSSGPVSISDGVVFATSGDTALTSLGVPISGQGGWVYGMSASNGKIIWRYETGASIYGGFSVSEKCAYVGIGYRYLNPAAPWSTGTSVLSFCM